MQRRVQSYPQSCHRSQACPEGLGDLGTETPIRATGLQAATPWLHVPSPSCEQPLGTPLPFCLSLPLPTLAGHCPLKPGEGRQSCFPRTPPGQAHQSPAPPEAGDCPLNQSFTAFPLRASGCSDADSGGGAEGACGKRQGRPQGRFCHSHTTPEQECRPAQGWGLRVTQRSSPRPGGPMLGRLALCPNPWGLTEASGPRRAETGWGPLPPWLLTAALRGGRKAGPDRPPWTYSSWTVAVHLGGWGQKHYQETDHPGWDQALPTKSKAAPVVLEQGGAHRAWLPQAVGRMVAERIRVKSGHKASALHPPDQPCGRAVASWTVSVSLCGLISLLLLGCLLGRFPAEPSGGRGPLGPVQDEPHEFTIPGRGSQHTSRNGGDSREPHPTSPLSALIISVAAPV